MSKRPAGKKSAYSRLSQNITSIIANADSKRTSLKTRPCKKLKLKPDPTKSFLQFKPDEVIHSQSNIDASSANSLKSRPVSRTWAPPLKINKEFQNPNKWNLTSLDEDKSNFGAVSNDMFQLVKSNKSNLLTEEDFDQTPMNTESTVSDTNLKSNHNPFDENFSGAATRICIKRPKEEHVDCKQNINIPNVTTQMSEYLLGKDFKTKNDTHENLTQIQILPNIVPASSTIKDTYGSHIIHHSDNKNQLDNKNGSQTSFGTGSSPYESLTVHETNTDMLAPDIEEDLENIGSNDSTQLNTVCTQTNEQPNTDLSAIEKLHYSDNNNNHVEDQMFENTQTISLQNKMKGVIVEYDSTDDDERGTKIIQQNSQEPEFYEKSNQVNYSSYAPICVHGLENTDIEVLFESKANVHTTLQEQEAVTNLTEFMIPTDKTVLDSVMSTHDSLSSTNNVFQQPSRMVEDSQEENSFSLITENININEQHNLINKTEKRSQEEYVSSPKHKYVNTENICNEDINELNSPMNTSASFLGRTPTKPSNSNVHETIEDFIGNKSIHIHDKTACNDISTQDTVIIQEDSNTDPVMLNKIEVRSFTPDVHIKENPEINNNSEQYPSNEKSNLNENQQNDSESDIPNSNPQHSQENTINILKDIGDRNSEEHTFLVPNIYSQNQEKYNDLINDSDDFFDIPMSQVIKIENEYKETTKNDTKVVTDHIRCNTQSEQNVQLQQEQLTDNINNKTIKPLPQRPRLDWVKKTNEEKQKLRLLIQEISALNSIVLQARKEIWPQQFNPSNK